MSSLTLGYGACALGYAGCAGVVLAHRQIRWSDVVLAVACTATASWAGLSAVHPVPQLAGMASLAQLISTLGWYGFALFLYRKFVRTEPKLVPAFGTFDAIGLAIAIFILAISFAPGRIEASLKSIWIDARFGMAMAVLLILENLYRNVNDEGRWHVNLFCIAIAGTTVYSTLVFADAVLHRGISVPLYQGQAIANLLVLPLLLLGAWRTRHWKEDRIVMSQRAVFQSATLLISGIFLLALAVAGEAFRRYGSGWGRVAELSVIFGGLITLLVLIASGSVRSKIYAILVDHFGVKRYDYRAEWLRCIKTLSSDAPCIPLHLRVIRTIADAVDSPAGMLFLAKGASEAHSASVGFETGGVWNMPEKTLTVPNDHPLVVGLRRSGNVVADAELGSWFCEIPNTWLAVPLNYAGALSGFVLLSSPRAAFQLDREVFELLGIIGREIALFIAEQRATEALAEARQFEEAGRRFAFVAHDVKNVASQLSLLLANAEQNMENPEFRRDMVATLRGAVQKIGVMIARLRAPSTGKPLALVSPRQRIAAAVEAVRAASGRMIPVTVDSGSGKIAMEESAFDAVIRHILDNAIEASLGTGNVCVQLCHFEDRAVIEVVDEGVGMSPAFVRDQLFRPFVSSKKRGLGIGAFQARELVREVGGEVEVESARERGTTMRIILPLAVGSAVPVMTEPGK